MIDVKLPSINSKYNINRYTGQLFICDEYRKFKADVFNLCVAPPNFNCLNPFSLEIYIKTYKDIDAVLKPLLDGISAKIGFDDKYINCIHLYKEPIKKCTPETLRVVLQQNG